MQLLNGIRSKRPKTKMSQLHLPTRPIFGESKRPKYIFTILNQTRDSKHFFVNTLVKMSQSQIVPSQKSQSQNVPESKCPRVKTSQVKMSQVKTSQSQNVPSQNVPSCLSACKQHCSHSYEVLTIQIIYFQHPYKIMNQNHGVKTK